jgi:hypothetical protein
MTTGNPSHAYSSALSRYAAPAQQAALATGAVFLFVGILGFNPGLTFPDGQLTFAGHHSKAAQFGPDNWLDLGLAVALGLILGRDHEGADTPIGFSYTVTPEIF